MIRKQIDLTEALLNTWKTTHQVSLYLIRNIPLALWKERIPGYPRKTIGMLAIHLHNARCMWIKSITKEKLTRIDRHGTRKELIVAMHQSHKAMLHLLDNCIAHGGQLISKPPWLNFPDDVMHLLTYFVAHEGHHRGQIIMAARQLDQPFVPDVIGGVWQWKKRLKESKVR